MRIAIIPPNEWTVPYETWRELNHQAALGLLADLTRAGSDPEKVTAILHKILKFNEAMKAVVVIEQP